MPVQEVHSHFFLIFDLKGFLWEISIPDTDSTTDIDTPVIVGDSSLLVRIGPNIHRLIPCSGNGDCSGDTCACVSSWYNKREVIHTKRQVCL